MADKTTNDKIVEWILIGGVILLVVVIVIIAILFAKHHTESLAPLLVA